MTLPRPVAVAHERGLLVDADEHRVARRAGRSSARAGARPRVPWYGKIARPGTRPSPTVYAPPRGSTIGSHSTVAPAPDAAITAPPPVRVDAARRRARCPSAPSAGAAASRRRGRRTARPRTAGDVRVGLGVAPVEHRAGRVTFAPSPSKYAAARSTDPLGMLERGRGRAAPAPRRSRRARAAGCRRSRHGSVHSPPPTSASGPGRLRSRRRHRLTGGAYGRGAARLAAPTYPPVTFRPSLEQEDVTMTVKRVGIVGSGIMGSGIAEVAAKAGLRGRAAQPGAGAPPTRWSPGSRSRSPSRSSGASSKPTERDAVLGRVARRHRPRRARRVRPRDRVDRRGPRREEAPLHRARPHLPRRHDPRDQHVDAAGRRDGDGDRAAPTRCAASTSSTRRR